MFSLISLAASSDTEADIELDIDWDFDWLILAIVETEADRLAEID